MPACFVRRTTGQTNSVTNRRTQLLRSLNFTIIESPSTVMRRKRPYKIKRLIRE